jgi:hypothetical protein
MKTGLAPLSMIGALILVAAPLAAATPPASKPAPKPAVQEQAPLDPAAKAAAEELLTLISFEKTMEEGTQASLTAMRSGVMMGRQLDANPQLRLERAKNPQAWDKALRRIGALQADAAEAEAKATMPDIKAMAVDIYARKFTAADLRGFIALYQTPIGKTLLDGLPQVMGNTMVVAQAMLSQRMAPRMRALQPTIQAELAPLLPKPSGK